MQLLFVEDNPHLLEALRLRARHYRYQCHTDLSGAYCISKAHKYKPSAIILDLDLPRISGLGLIRELKRRKSLKKIPIIVFSGNTEKMIVKEALELGANAFVPKGAKIDVLFDKVSEHTH